MEPLSTLPLACNVLDLVGKAAKSGAAVVQVYQFADGCKKALDVISRSFDNF